MTGAYTVDAYRSNLPDAIFNLTFNPPVITETTESFTFSGTWKNYRVLDCVAAVPRQFQEASAGMNGLSDQAPRAFRQRWSMACDNFETMQEVGQSPATKRAASFR